MIVTCPACATRYVVDPAAIGSDGRTVRCANCRHEWFQTVPEDVLAEREEAAAAPVEETPPADAAGPEATPADPGGAETFGETPPESAGEEMTAPRRRERPLPRGNNLPAVRDDARRQWMIGWAAVGAALVLLVGVLVGFRGNIMQAWPGAAGIYQAVGLGPAASANGTGSESRSAGEVLLFSNLNLNLDQEDGVPVLTVTGRIENPSDRAYDVPRVEATLLDSAKSELHSWTFEAPVTRLEAGATARFSTRLSNPPTSVREAVLEFIPPEEGSG